MIDYGIICLFALQIAALAGALWAWSSIRYEIREVRELKNAVDTQQGIMKGQISSLQEYMEGQISSLRALEVVPRNLQKKMDEWEANMASLQSASDTMGQRIRSLHSRINADLRHSKAKAAADDDDDQAEPIDQGQQLIFPAPPPAPPAPAVAPGFGRKRTA